MNNNIYLYITKLSKSYYYWILCSLSILNNNTILAPKWFGAKQTPTEKLALRVEQVEQQTPGAAIGIVLANNTIDPVNAVQAALKNLDNGYHQIRYIRSDPNYTIPKNRLDSRTLIINWPDISAGDLTPNAQHASQYPDNFFELLADCFTQDSMGYKVFDVRPLEAIMRPILDTVAPEPTVTIKTKFMALAQAARARNKNSPPTPATLSSSSQGLSSRSTSRLSINIPSFNNKSNEQPAESSGAIVHKPYMITKTGIALIAGSSVIGATALLWLLSRTR